MSVYSFLQRRDELTLTKLSLVPPAASKSDIDTGICAFEPMFLVRITRLSPAREEGVGPDLDIAAARYTGQLNHQRRW